MGRGVSTCAVCDAAFYRGKKAIVVGGGDAAIEDALTLTKFASEVTLVVRRDKLRASVIMQKRILDNSKVKILWNNQIEKINGKEKIESVVIGGKIIATDGLFFAIGHVPATKFVEGSGVEMDEQGYIKIANGAWPTMTSAEGVFAAGDCVDHRYRQAATAVGMGVSAALDCERWLESR
jgi:thioredoxin reductase (NADPH)